MTDGAPPDAAEVGAETARFYDELERGVESEPPTLPRLVRLAHAGLSAVALGVLSAGLAIFAVFVLLNLVFHFASAG